VTLTTGQLREQALDKLAEARRYRERYDSLCLNPGTPRHHKQLAQQEHEAVMCKARALCLQYEAHVHADLDGALQFAAGART